MPMKEIEAQIKLIDNQIDKINNSEMDEKTKCIYRSALYGRMAVLYDRMENKNKS